MKKSAWGIQTRLLLLTGLILIVPFFLFLFLHHRLTQSFAIQNSGFYFQEMAEIAAAKLQDSIEMEVRKLRLITFDSKVQAALEERGSAELSPEETAALAEWNGLRPDDPFLARILTGEAAVHLNHYLVSEPGLLRELALVDSRGIVAAATRRPPQADLRDAAWWNLLERSGNPAWFLEKKTAQTQVSPVLLLHIAVPVETVPSPRRVGALYAVLNFQPVMHFLRDLQLGKTGRTLFVAPEEKLVLIAPYGAQQEAAPWVEAFQKRAQRSGWEIERGADGGGRLRGYARVFHDDSVLKNAAKAARWWLVVEQSAEESLDPLLPFWYGSIGAALLLMIALFYAAVGVIRGIGRPLRKLQESAKLAEVGGAGPLAGLERGDEIGELARSIRQTILHLKRFKEESASKSRELAEMNEELARQNLLKGNFISMVSHELRTPLTTLSGYVKFLKDGKAGALAREQHECLDSVDKQIRHLSYLIEQLLHISRIESGKQEAHAAPVYVPGVAHDCAGGAEPKAAVKKIRIENRIGEHLPLAYADRNHLVQIFTNLLDNALKYTPPGGKIVLTGEDKGEFLEFCVRDTGPGIPPEFQQRIFERFFRLEEGKASPESGLGLGLSIVKNLVELNGGKIWLKSALEKGSEFYFLIPKYPLAGS